MKPMIYNTIMVGVVIAAATVLSIYFKDGKWMWLLLVILLLWES